MFDMLQSQKLSPIVYSIGATIITSTKMMTGAMKITFKCLSTHFDISYYVSLLHRKLPVSLKKELFEH